MALLTRADGSSPRSTIPWTVAREIPSSPATSPALKSAEAGFGPDAVGPKPSTFLSTFRTGFVGKFGTAGKEVLCGLSPTSRNYEWLGRLCPVSEGWESRSSASGAEGHWFESSIARSRNCPRCLGKCLGPTGPLPEPTLS